MYFPVVLFIKRFVIDVIFQGILRVLFFVILFTCKLFYNSQLWCVLCVSERVKFYNKSERVFLL